MDIELVVKKLRLAKKMYYNSGKTIMTDEEFDLLEAQLRQEAPDHEYFKDTGAPVVRGQKVKHSSPMGSLNQVSSIEELKKWALHHPKNSFVASAKYDGNSVRFRYGNSGVFVQAITRGDGVEGLDITRHIKRMIEAKNPSILGIIKNGPAEIRGELILSRKTWKEVINKNSDKKNARNYVAGQLNRTVAEEDFINHAEFIAFDATLEDDPFDSYTDMMNWLSWCKFKHAWFNEVIFDEFDEVISSMFDIVRHPDYDYECDGVVIDIDDGATRDKLGITNSNPNYAVKYKVNTTFVETPVVDVHYGISKDNYLIPRVEFEPVELAGVTITFATGFNAGFIRDNKIGPGATVRITRSGDVIPFIESVITGAEAKLPTEPHVWTETGVHAVAIGESPRAKILQAVDFFTSIDAAQLKEGNVTKLFEAGHDSIESIILADEDELSTVLGATGQKVYNSVRQQLSGIPLAKLAGALPYFGRGVGQRKMARVIDAFGEDFTEATVGAIESLEGFDTKTAEKIVAGFTEFKQFIHKIGKVYTVPQKASGELADTVVVFTGVRDKALEQKIASKGGTIGSSVTGKTTHLIAKDPSGNSGKLDKARKSGVKVISLDDAQRLWG